MPRVFISGIGRRLGLHLAEQFLAQGWLVFGQYRRASEQTEALAKRGVRLYQCDFTDAGQLLGLAERLAAELPSLDLLLHNASLFEGESEHATLSEHLGLGQRAMALHFHAPQILSEALQAALRSARGQIIAITDIYSQLLRPDKRAYCASKAALSCLMQGYAVAWAPHIRVNCIAPGPLSFLPEHSEAQRAQVLASTPLGREGGFEPVWQVVEMLLANDFITGETLKVDGGRSLSAW